jgi:hypothetical protein
VSQCAESVDLQFIDEIVRVERFKAAGKPHGAERSGQQPQSHKRLSEANSYGKPVATACNFVPHRNGNQVRLSQYVSPRAYQPIGTVRRKTLRSEIELERIHFKPHVLHL